MSLAVVVLELTHTNMSLQVKRTVKTQLTADCTNPQLQSLHFVDTGAVLCIGKKGIWCFRKEKQFHIPTKSGLFTFNRARQILISLETLDRVITKKEFTIDITIKVISISHTFHFKKKLSIEIKIYSVYCLFIQYLFIKQRNVQQKF